MCRQFDSGLRHLDFENRITKMREWLSGGASPCQGEGRGFDPRLALVLLLEIMAKNKAESAFQPLKNFDCI